MFRRISTAVQTSARLKSASRRQTRRVDGLLWIRYNATSTSSSTLNREHVDRYKDKLSEKVKQEGVADIQELAQKAKARQPKPEPLGRSMKLNPQGKNDVLDGQSSLSTTPKRSPRKDSSPVKPLGDIMDLNRILAKPHTSEQISSLWNTYHSSRSSGTGRGFLSASLPLSTYTSLLSTARKHPTFILPLPRPQEGSDELAHEFFFLEWALHNAPPAPDAFPPPSAASPSPNPPISTIIFTSLAEYKLRQSFAQPQLVLTHYTELAASHGNVLLRGELTPSTTSPGRFTLSQQDAQLLVFGIQRFYLGVGGDGGGVEGASSLLETFHEKPDQFKWEELIRLMNPTSV